MADSDGNDGNEPQDFTLSTRAARQLATTTKSAPQMQGLTSRWLLKILPWVSVRGGAYRVNRVVQHERGGGRLSFIVTGPTVQVVPQSLTEIPFLRGFEDQDVLNEMASLFVQPKDPYKPSDEIATQGKPGEQLIVIVTGKANEIVSGPYNDPERIDTLVSGNFFGDEALLDKTYQWPFTVKTATNCTVLTLPRKAFDTLVKKYPQLQKWLDKFKAKSARSLDRYGQAKIEIAAGHKGQPKLPATFVDYEIKPREYELSVAQTILRVNTRVADLYNDPMNQTEQQLKLVVEQLREREEDELINNSEFGLLNNVEPGQRICTRSGPPTPDDFDELLTRRRDPQFLLAHPRTISAFGRECNKLGIYPQNVDLGGHQVPAWRGVPLLPCTKIPISKTYTSSVLVLRTGENNQGVIGLNQIGIPDEYEPGLNVRFMGIDEKATISYLVSAYFSVAVLVPDALGILDDVEVGR